MRPSPKIQLTLTISSWLGYAILIVLAIYLTWRHSGSVTPLTLLTLGLCVVIGAALPVFVHLINYWWAKALLEAEEKEANLSLRSAVARIEAVHDRFEDLQGSASKAVLVARQVPERIEEKTDPLVEAVASLDLKRFERIRESLDEHGERMRANHERSQVLEGQLRQLQETLGSLSDNLSTAPQTPPTPEWVDGLREELAGLKTELVQALESSAEKAQARTKTKPKRKAKAASEEAKAQPEPELEDERDAEPEPQAEWGTLVEAGRAELQETDSDRIVVIVKCMTGIRNRLYMRGEGPGLSWDEPKLLELTGIGEYRLELQSADRAIAFKLLLNDEVWSEGGNYEARPGQILRIQPNFPSA